jgi:tetratricopeptide (TPR) repeat protein
MSRFQRFVAQVIFLSAIFCLSAAHVARSDDNHFVRTYFKWCNGDEPEVSLNRQITGCTNLIHSDSVDPEGRTIAFFRRGMAYYKSKLYDRAIKDFTSAIGRKPDFAPAFLGRGWAYHEKGDYDAAIINYDRAILLFPNYAVAYGSRCWARAVAGKDLHLALADCNRALALQPANKHTLDSRCLVQFRLGDAEAALADCDAALRIDAKLAPSLYVRGLTKLRKGDKAGGDADIAAAVALDPAIVETYVRYGIAQSR